MPFIEISGTSEIFPFDFFNMVALCNKTYLIFALWIIEGWYYYVPKIFSYVLNRSNFERSNEVMFDYNTSDHQPKSLFSKACNITSTTSQTQFCETWCCMLRLFSVCDIGVVVVFVVHYMQGKWHF